MIILNNIIRHDILAHFLLLRPTYFQIDRRIDKYDSESWQIWRQIYKYAG